MSFDGKLAFRQCIECDTIYGCIKKNSALKCNVCNYEKCILENLSDQIKNFDKELDIEITNGVCSRKCFDKIRAKERNRKKNRQ